MSLPRCQHGIYLAREDEQRTGLAWFCVDCRQKGWGRIYRYGVGETARNLLAPKKYIGTDRRDLVAEGRRANRHEKHSDACPSCGSQYRYTIAGSVDVECSECGNRWRPRRSEVNSQAKFLEVAA